MAQPNPNSIAYIFDGITFYREFTDGMQPWFGQESLYTRDAVLGGENLDYLDIGATLQTDLEFQGTFFSYGAQQAMIARARTYTTAVLNKSDGSSQLVTIMRAKEALKRTRGRYFLDLLFIPRPMV